MYISQWMNLVVRLVALPGKRGWSLLPAAKAKLPFVAWVCGGCILQCGWDLQNPSLRHPPLKGRSTRHASRRQTCVENGTGSLLVAARRANEVGARQPSTIEKLCQMDPQRKRLQCLFSSRHPTWRKWSASCGVRSLCIAVRVMPFHSAIEPTARASHQDAWCGTSSGLLLTSRT